MPGVGGTHMKHGLHRCSVTVHPLVAVVGFSDTLVAVSRPNGRIQATLAPSTLKGLLSRVKASDFAETGLPTQT